MPWPFARADQMIGSSDPGSIYLGRYWNPRTGRVEGKLQYGGNRHLIVLGPTGSGKGARLIVPNALQGSSRSEVQIDPKGANAAISAPWRRKVSKVLILNPFGVLADLYPDLVSVGFNPLATLDPDSPTYFDDCAGLGEALIRIEGKDPHWSQSAQGLVVAIIMWEVIEAKRHGRIASLENVRRILTEPDEYERGRDGKQRLVRGLRFTAALMCATGGPLVESLISRFLNDTDEMSSIRSTADTQTRWLLSEPIRADMAKPGIDFASLKREPTTVYVILPAERLETHSVWLRVVVSTALRALYRPGGVPVLLVLDEAAHLGRLQPVESALGLVRGYGVRLLLVLQSLSQLRDIYGESAYENFLGQAGAVLGFAPNDWLTADWMSRRSGEMTIRQPNISTNQNPGGIGTSMGEGYGRRPYLMPQDLFGLREGFGFVWCAGQARPVPTYAPAYWHVDAWRRRARADPYHLGKATQ
jgi:type IV secretion system protein VirD4